MSKLEQKNGLYGFLLNEKYNMAAVIIYITFFLVISPLIPGVYWFKIGDFSLDMINWYHVIMIPFTFILILYTARLLGLDRFTRYAINASTYPILFFTTLGLAFFYPASTQTADYVVQAIRDVWILIIAFIFFVSLIVTAIRQREKFKKIWGAYVLIILATLSAGLAAVMGMIGEYGTLYGFSAIPSFNNLVISWGGTATFLDNIIGNHNHQMLPAVMGGIVGVAAVSFGYHRLEGWKRHVVNAGMIISTFGVISMTYLYEISSFGTYAIPAIAPFGPSGMNGLALDDNQTGIIGWGALISIIGLYYILSHRKTDRIIQIGEVFTWLVTMAVMIGVGYTIEFNEVFYGFGSPGAPPNGGPGYQYDLAFTNGHLIFSFFLMPLIAGIILVLLHYVSGLERGKQLAMLFIFSGALIAAQGVLIYTMTLSWGVEAIGVVLLIIAMIIISALMVRSGKNLNAEQELDI